MKFFKCKADKAVYPERATTKSAGYDLTAIDHGEELNGCLVYDTGVGVGELPPGHCIKLYARSSIRKMDLRLANGVGVIDEDYPGTIQVTFDIANDVSFGDLKRYKEGDRIAQLVVEPIAHETDNVDVKKIRQGGHGSTGKKTFKKAKKGDKK